MSLLAVAVPICENNKLEIYIMTEKLDIASATRKLKSPNIKTRKRALKALNDLSKLKSFSK